MLEADSFTLSLWVLKVGLGSPGSEALFLSMGLFSGDVLGSSLETDEDLRLESEALSSVTFLAGLPSGEVSSLSRETEVDSILESEQLFLFDLAETDSGSEEGERSLFSFLLLDGVFDLGFWGSLGVLSGVWAGVSFLMGFLTKSSRMETEDLLGLV